MRLMDLSENNPDPSQEEHHEEASAAIEDLSQEYETLNSTLDQLDSCLDSLESKNDRLFGELQELLESNRQARHELQAMRQEEMCDGGQSSAQENGAASANIPSTSGYVDLIPEFEHAERSLGKGDEEKNSTSDESSPSEMETESQENSLPDVVPKC